MGHKLFSRYFGAIFLRVFLTSNINGLSKSLRLPADMNLNQQQLAQTFAVSDRTIRQWQTEGMPVELQAHGGNGYRLSDCIEWVVRRRFGNELTCEKTRLTLAMATKTELETKLLQQELLQTNLANITWGMFRQDLKQKVRAIPEQLTDELLRQKTLVECKTQLKEIFSEALADLSSIEAMAK